MVNNKLKIILFKIIATYPKGQWVKSKGLLQTIWVSWTARHLDVCYFV